MAAQVENVVKKRRVRPDLKAKRTRMKCYENTSKLCHRCKERLIPAQHWRKNKKTQQYSFSNTHGVRVCSSKTCNKDDTGGQPIFDLKDDNIR